MQDIMTKAVLEQVRFVELFLLLNHNIKSNVVCLG